YDVRMLIGYIGSFASVVLEIVAFPFAAFLAVRNKFPLTSAYSPVSGAFPEDGLFAVYLLRHACENRNDTFTRQSVCSQSVEFGRVAGFCQIIERRRKINQVRCSFYNRIRLDQLRIPCNERR